MWPELPFEQIKLVPTHQIIARGLFAMPIVFGLHALAAVVIKALGFGLPQPKYFEERVWRWSGVYSPSIDRSRLFYYRIAWGIAYLAMLTILIVTHRYFLQVADWLAAQVYELNR
jgi:hypothetical protein